MGRKEEVYFFFFLGKENLVNICILMDYFFTNIRFLNNNSFVITCYDFHIVIQ